MQVNAKAAFKTAQIFHMAPLKSIPPVPKVRNPPDEPKPPSADPRPTPREPAVLLKPSEELGGGGGGAVGVWEKSELLWEVGATEPEP